MDVASLILGIVILLIIWIPFCGPVAVIPALVGFILGIISLLRKKKKRESTGIAISGTVLNGISLFIFAIHIVLMIFLHVTDDKPKKHVKSVKNSNRVEFINDSLRTVSDSLLSDID